MKALANTCGPRACGQMLVRGDRISFVSTEQVRRVGAHELNDKKMPSDLVCPPSYVLVGDPSGTMFDNCHFYVVKWSQSRAKRSNIEPEAKERADEYFGSTRGLQVGSVDIPKGPWQRVAKVKYIRYRRFGEHAGNYEHTWEFPVTLQVSQNPLAWRVPLPQGCVVDERGFVWP
jgi:hypothetical protein